MEIRNDRLKGMSYTELGRKYHIDSRTAKKYAESPHRPEYTLSGRKPSKLDEYKQQMDVWLEEAPYSAVRILEKLQEHGFTGKYSIVKEWNMYAAGRWIWMKKRRYGSRLCQGCKVRWIGDSLRITMYLRMVNSKNCTASYLY